MKCLKHGADIEYKNHYGWTPLIVSAYNGSSDVMDLLIQLGAGVNVTNYKGTTPLMYALSYYERAADRTCFDLLLKNGCNINFRDISGKTVSDYMREKNN